MGNMAKERPILFSIEMVKAILEGRKFERKIYITAHKDLGENEILTMRIINGTKVNDETGCWEWTRAKNNYGYGTMTINKKTKHVHRLVYALMCGEIPKTAHVLHSCDNPSCVNPEHLHLGTRSDNMKECYQRGRSKVKPVSFKGEENGMAKLAANDVLEIKKEIRNGVKQRVIAEKFNVSQSQISNIKLERKWGNAN